MKIDWQKYKVVVGYGIGQYYEKTKEELRKTVKLDYLCDRKWEEGHPDRYDGIEIIDRDGLKRLKDALVVVLIGSRWGYESIRKDIETFGLTALHVDDILYHSREITGKKLKEEFPNGSYEDGSGNHVVFDRTIPDNLLVYFHGQNNKLVVGKNILTGSLQIYFGNNGFCSIGEGTEIIGGCLLASEAKIIIGKDCLFSTEIIVRNHDAHHIFDLNTHKRINYSRDIVIGDQVWIGQRVTLLGGAMIGTGSVVGTNAVTSSQFGDHVVIAGCPAKVIRENVCWSRENTDYFNRDCFDECTSQEALKYI